MFLNYYYKIEEIMKNNKGYLWTKEVFDQKISKNILYNFIKKNNLIKIKSGLYKNKVQNDIFFELQKKYPNIIFSHECALFLHNLMEREPFKITFTIPYNFYKKNFKNENCEIHYKNKDLYNLGIETIKTYWGNEIKIYEKERVLCEILKNKENMDIQIFTFAWKRYLQEKPDFFKLRFYAKKLGVIEKLKTLLEVNLW